MKHLATSIAGTRVLLSLVVIASLAPLAGHAERIAIETSRCAGADFGATRPTGIAYDSLRDELVVVDAATEKAYFFDRHCNVSSTVDLTLLDARHPTGVTYRADLDAFAVSTVEPAQLQVFTPAGESAGACSLAAAGLVNPTAIAWVDALARFAVLDEATGEIVYVDGSNLGGGACTIAERVSSAAVGVQQGAALTQATPDAALVALDGADRRAHLLDAGANELIDEFGTRFSLDSVQPAGIAYAAQAGRYYVVDGQTTVVHEVDARGSTGGRCVPGGRIDDFTIDTLRSLVLVLDRDTRTVRRYRLSDCTELGSALFLGDFGIASTFGVGYNDRDDQYVFTESGDPGALYFVDVSSLSLARTCNPQRVGDEPRRVSGIGSLGWLFVFGEGFELPWYAVLDGDCNLIEQWPETDLGETGGSFLPGVGALVTAEAGPASVNLVTLEGLSVYRIDPRDLRVGSRPDSIRALPGSGGRFLVAIGDSLYRWSVPLFAEPFGASGTFSRGALSVSLFELGDGTSLLGTIALPGRDLRIVGTFDRDTAAVSVSFQNPQGTLVTLNGTVEADLQAIVLPPPLGRLPRQQ